MPNSGKKGITVRIDANLHAQVSQYLRDHSMTMAELVSRALDDELHPKTQMKEGNTIPSVLGHCFHLSAIETPAVVIIVIPKSEIRNFNNLLASV